MQAVRVEVAESTDMQGQQGHSADKSGNDFEVWGKLVDHFCVLEALRRRRAFGNY